MSRAAREFDQSRSGLSPCSCPHSPKLVEEEIFWEVGPSVGRQSPLIAANPHEQPEGSRGVGCGWKAATCGRFGESVVRSLGSVLVVVSTLAMGLGVGAFVELVRVYLQTQHRLHVLAHLFNALPGGFSP